MKIVQTKKELKEAVTQREHVFIQDAKLCRVIKKLAPLQKGAMAGILILTSSTLLTAPASLPIRYLTGGSTGASVSIPTGFLVYLTTIIGAVAVIAILKEYEIIVRPEGVELRPKSTYPVRDIDHRSS